MKGFQNLSSFILPFLFFTVFCQPILSQPSKIDSLRQALTIAKTGGDSVEIIQHIAELSSDDEPVMAANYADTLRRIVERHNYEKGWFYVLHFEANSYLYDGNYEEALKRYQQQFPYLQYFENAREIESVVLNNIGITYSDLGQSDSAIVYFLKYIDITRELDDKIGEAIAHNNIGDIYSDAGAYQKSIEHFNKSFNIRKAIGAEDKLYYSYSKLASVYGRMKEYAIADSFAQIGMEQALKYENLIYAGVISNNHGNDYISQDMPEKAIPYLEKAVDYFGQRNHRLYQTYPYSNLARAHTQIGNFQKAIEYGEKGYAIVEEMNLEDQKELYYESLGEAYYGAGNYKKAFEWYQQKVAILDTLIKNDNMRQVAEIEAKYQTQKKEAELAQKQLEVEKEKFLRNQVLFGAILSILALLAVFQYFRNRFKIKRREAQIALQLKETESAQLKELDQLKSTFFANISHEFRTPLTLIISPLEQILKGTFKGNKEKYFGIMHRNALRLQGLINQLLDLSKLETGKLKLQTQEGDIFKFLKAIAGSFESLALRKEIDYHINIPNISFYTHFDKDKIEKIVANLLSNAFKFTPEEGIVSITVSHQEEELQSKNAHSPTPLKGVFIKVKDSGIGITKEELPHIFDRFFQSNESSGGYVHSPGTGIGLALTRELVELHDGKIEVESDYGKGSIFSVFLPLQLVEKPGLATVFAPPEMVSANAYSPILPRDENKATTKGKSKRKIVLVVEDNPDVRQYIVEQLTDTYTVKEAVNGKEGLKKAAELMPDLVITDLMMPEMDGQALCEKLRKNSLTSHIPVVMLTAKASQADKLEGLEKGADDYLVKPFNVQELQVRVANLIAQRQRLAERYSQEIRIKPKEVAVVSTDEIFLQQVLKAVEDNLDDETFSVEVLGKAVNMSRSQLHRKLKALTGKSPSVVIREMRLERAKSLLEQGAGNTTEIAFMVGFNSLAYFTKCFSDRYNQTPSSILKK